MSLRFNGTQRTDDRQHSPFGKLRGGVYGNKARMVMFYSFNNVGIATKEIKTADV